MRRKIRLQAANEETVRMICDHLVEAYQQFLDHHDHHVNYIDGFMGVHNFHKQVVLDLEARFPELPKGLLRQSAAATFNEAMERPDLEKGRGRRSS